VVGLAKAEAWDNPVLAWLFNLWGAIPVKRGEPDLAALRSCLDFLRNGGILVVAPEGTRSRHGRLQRGHSGIVTLALRSGAPILPLAFYGGEALKRNARRLRRTPFHIVVGEPFHLSVEGRVTQTARQDLTDQIMYKLAALLPPAYRGEYAAPPSASEA
jgi:1-acyl-sn-glycerol-3-phosphate acyltransferase